MNVFVHKCFQNRTYCTFFFLFLNTGYDRIKLVIWNIFMKIFK